jgi:hypothetical protein
MAFFPFIIMALVVGPLCSKVGPCKVVVTTHPNTIQVNVDLTSKLFYGKSNFQYLISNPIFFAICLNFYQEN